MAQYRQMKEQGIRFVVASGNQYYQLISFFPELASEISFVAENGGWVVSEGEDVFNGELAKDDFQAIVEHLLTRTDIDIIACGKSSAYTLKQYSDEHKAVSAMYYHRLEFVDNFDNLNDVFFKFGLNISDDRIPQVQADLHEAIGDIMVPVHTGYGSIDLIILACIRQMDCGCCNNAGILTTMRLLCLAMVEMILKCCARRDLVLQWPTPMSRLSRQRNIARDRTTKRASWILSTAC